MATAYSLKGRTASGVHTRPGIAAADPRVLPLGSRIQVRGAGRYSGQYTVSDTGAAIVGRRIDLYIADHAEARRFGRRAVQVEVTQPAAGMPHGVAHHRRHRSRPTVKARVLPSS